MGMHSEHTERLWVAEVEPAARVGRAYLPLRSGEEGDAELRWIALPQDVRAQIELVGGWEAEPEDGPIDDERWYAGVWLADSIAMDAVYAALRILAPFVEAARLLIGCDEWIDEVTIVAGVVRADRAQVSRAAQLEHLAARAAADPGLRRVTARMHREAARGAAPGWVWRLERSSGALIGPDGERAQQWLAVARSLAPDDGEAWALCGCLARARGDHEAARDGFTRALALGCPRAVVRVGLAELARRAGDLASAAAHLRAAVELPDAPADVYHRLGLTLQELGRLDEAVAIYGRSISSRPQASSGSKLNLGNTHAARKDWPAALACYDAAIAEAPTMALAWGGRGQALRNLGRLAEAGVALERALELDAGLANVWLELATLHFADGERAVKLCDEALARDPKCGYTWSTRGSALNNLGRFAEAEASLTRAIELRPEYGHPWYCRACTYALQGRAEEALAAAARALELDPSWRPAMRTESDLRSLRDDPRFVALMRG